jgi:hypothetical protein
VVREHSYRNSEQANPQGQKADGWCRGLGEGEDGE